MHERGHLVGEGALGDSALGRRSCSSSSASISSSGRSENIRRYGATIESSAWIQNWRNWYGEVLSASSQTAPPTDLPNFEPSAFVTSGWVSAWALAAEVAADEVDTGDDVAPLVGAAGLQLDTVVLVQMTEVVGLQQRCS